MTPIGCSALVILSTQRESKVCEKANKAVERTCTQDHAKRLAHRQSYCNVIKLRELECCQGSRVALLTLLGPVKVTGSPIFPF